MGFWEEDHGSKVLFLSHHMKKWVHKRDIAIDVNLVYLAEVLLVKFFHCKVTAHQYDLWPGQATPSFSI